MDNKQIVEVSVKINNLLSQYVKTHDDIFKNSIRNVIPLLFIFKKIDFQVCYKNLEDISSKLKENDLLINKMSSDCDERQKKYLEVLSEYVKALIRAVELLKFISSSLYAKSEHLTTYNWKQYKEELARYESAVQEYRSIGSRLNELYDKIT